MSFKVYCKKCGTLYDAENTPAPHKCPRCGHAYTKTLRAQLKEWFKPLAAVEHAPRNDWPEDRARVRALLRGKPNND